MRSVIDDYFLLHSKSALKLFNEHAANIPIIDYHNHLNPQEIAEDKQYENMTEVWLNGDHYKWRTMRAMGYSEELVTGRRNVTAVDSFIDDEELDYRRFLAFADTVQNMVGNPIYYWTHLELKRYFDIDEALTPDTADYIWDKCNAMLQKKEFSAQGLLRKQNVQVLCTTDDPVDDQLSLDELMNKVDKDDSLPTIMLTHRPEKFKEISDAGCDLALAGHTHGFNIPQFMGRNIAYDMYYGRKDYNGMTAITTSGVSAWGFHYKFPAKSEIVSLHITFGN